jgi:hypothetical protein
MVIGDVTRNSGFAAKVTSNPDLQAVAPYFAAFISGALLHTLIVSTKKSHSSTPPTDGGGKGE